MKNSIALKLNLIQDPGIDRAINEDQLDIIKRGALIVRKIIRELKNDLDTILAGTDTNTKQEAWRQNPLLSRWLGKNELTETGMRQTGDFISLLHKEISTLIRLEAVEPRTCGDAESCGKNISLYSQPGKPLYICPNFFKEDEKNAAALIVFGEICELTQKATGTIQTCEACLQLAQTSPREARLNPANYMYLCRGYYDKMAAASPEIFTRRFISALNTPQATIIDKHDKVYLFGGAYFVGLDYNDNFLDLDTPKTIKDNWSGFPEEFAQNLDTAVNGHDEHAGKIFFFKGDNYISFDLEKEQVDPGYPRKIKDGWPGFPEEFSTNPDAAVNGNGPQKGKAFFFKGDEYLRFDWARNSVDPGYPRKIKDDWQGFPEEYCQNLSSALPGSGRREGKAYFFKDDAYVRYDWQKQRVDPDYPIEFLGNWDGKLFWIL